MGEVMALDVWTTAKFSKMILKLADEMQVPLVDVLVHYCERNKMEIETAAKLCNASIKRQIYADAQEANLVNKIDKYER
jgi:hypothetical protein